MGDMYSLNELNFEKTIGGEGILNDQREIPLIDLCDLAAHRDDIKEQLWQAATEVGFFQLVNHGIPKDTILSAFDASERFFALSQAQKSHYQLKEGLNAGWEFKAQVRPSTGRADQKESFQITLPHMDKLWPHQDQVAEFTRIMLDFEYRSWQLGMWILSCFAEKLGFDTDFFTKAHQRGSREYQSTLRLLHYLSVDESVRHVPGMWRAGAHTDFDCLTMVFQQDGQGGLQVCPGKEAMVEGGGQLWTNVEPQTDRITCNIGDMLMRWSDDRLKSTLHRVAMPGPDERQDSRYSMAFFCQANKDQVIKGTSGKYPSITAQDYLLQRIHANFARSS